MGKKKITPKVKVGDSIRTADNQINFSKSDTTNWFYKLHTMAEINNDTLPSYLKNILHERYN